MKRVLRWWPVLILILVAAGVGIWMKWGRTSASETVDLSRVFAVERGALVASISLTGEVYAPLQEELSFDVAKTRLIELNVKPGQRVKAGEVLARIDTAALERAVTQAQANLTMAQDELRKGQNPYSALDLFQARVAVDQTKIDLDDAKKNLEEIRNPPTELELAEARLAVSKAEIDLKDAKKNLETLRNPDIEAAQAAVQDATAALKSAQSQLIIVQNSSDNAAKLRTLEAEAEWYRNNYWQAQKKFERNEIDQQKLNWEYSNMLAAEERLKVAQVQSETSLASAKNKVVEAEKTLRKAREDLATLKNGPDALDLTRAENQVAQAELTLTKAKESLAKLEAGPDVLETAKSQIRVTQAEYNLAKAQEKLAEIEAGPDPKEIEVAKAKVFSAQANLEEAQAALEAATMIAPFDGTVVSVGAEVGQLVSSGIVVITLADLSDLRVRAIVDETDITKVEIGQQAEITFDAFPGRRFQGKVLEVPLQGTLMQSILTYAVPVSMKGAEDIALKPGMTANVRIILGRRDNALLVPATAVQQGEEGSVVLRQDTPYSTAVVVPVQVGLSDGTYVEILSGLEEGDHVLVTYQSAEQQTFGPRAGGGIMGGAQRMMRP